MSERPTAEQLRELRAWAEAVTPAEDAALNALNDITDDNCQLRGWPVKQLAEHFKRYRLAYFDRPEPEAPPADDVATLRAQLEHENRLWYAVNRDRDAAIAQQAELERRARELEDLSAFDWEHDAARGFVAFRGEACHSGNDGVPCVLVPKAAFDALAELLGTEEP